MLAPGAEGVGGDVHRTRSRPTCSAPRCPRREPRRSPGIRPCSAARGSRGWPWARATTALDLELRGLEPRRAALSAAGDPPLVRRPSGARRSRRAPPTANGWDRATASHNTVVVDGLNQRENIARARAPAPGGQFPLLRRRSRLPGGHARRPNAYPQSTTRYRQTLIGATAATTRYAVSVFEVHGGLQHDQLFHAAAGAATSWQMPAPLERCSGVPPAPVDHLHPRYPPEEGRWFVQAYGELALQGQLAALEARHGPLEPTRRARHTAARARRSAAGGLRRLEQRPHRRHERRLRAAPA